MEKNMIFIYFCVVCDWSNGMLLVFCLNVCFSVININIYIPNFQNDFSQKLYK